MKIEELILKYATLMPIRFKFRQKYMFINEIAKEYQALGYEVKATVNKKRGKKALNLMVGDLKSAKTLIVSHYDTPQRNFANPLKYYPLNGAFSFVRSFLAYYTPLILASLVTLFILMQAIQKVDFTNNFWQSLFIISVFMFSVVISTVMTKGLANKYNYNRNTSGVIGSLLVAEKLANRKDVAYILTDMGCMNHSGDKMVKEALPQTLKDKTVIILDCIGSGVRVGVGYREASRDSALRLINEFGKDNIYSVLMEENSLKYNSANYYEKAIVVSYGKKQGDDFVVENTASSHDTELNEEVVLGIVDVLAKFLKR